MMVGGEKVVTALAHDLAHGRHQRPSCFILQHKIKQRLSEECEQRIQAAAKTERGKAQGRQGQAGVQRQV